MNNRIKELMNQSWVQPTYIDCNGKECNHSPDVYPRYFSEEKFAELIIRECAKIGEDTDGNWNVKHEILKNFGLK